MLSIIIPTFHEEQGIAQTIAHLSARCDTLLHEIIVVDASATGATKDCARRAGARVYHTTASSRARQMNIGAANARGDVLLFLHADTRLPQSMPKDCEKFFADPQYGYGAFMKSFDDRHLFLRCIAWGNNLSTRYGQNILGDNGLLIRKDFFLLGGGFGDYVLMEDVAMSRRLKRLARQRHKKFFLFTGRVVTSARRFRRNGIYKTFFLMQYLRLRYACGTSPQKLKKYYM